MYLKIVPLIFYQNFVNNFCHDINIYILLNHFYNVCIHEVVTIPIFNSASFTFFVIVSVFSLCPFYEFIQKDY